MDQVRCSFVIHFLVVTSFKNNKKAQGKSHFSALVISLCFIGGYLPSRVLVLIIFGFVLPRYPVLIFQYLYTDTIKYIIAQNFYFFKL